jgi:exonuclease VII small subunit
MNKKAENANVVSETKKISEKHLTELQGHVSRINSAQLQLGQLTSQKHGVLNAIPQLQTQLKTFQDKMEEVYGKVSINIQDGTFQEVPEQADEQANT